jgi:O-antigen/teichoic acid export membrane protein
LGTSRNLNWNSQRIAKHAPTYPHVTRISQFARGLGSSWLATFATVIYSILSVPIALRYLSVEEFGLFVLLIQVSAYFTLLEFGISSASARILVDYKDSPNDGRYGSVILTGSCFLGLQGLLIIAIGVVAAPWIITAIGVPANFAEVATVLLRSLAVTSSLSLAFRMYGAVLYANKRLDWIHAITGGNMLLGVPLLFVILASGGGLGGLIWLFITQTTVAILLPVFVCVKLGLLPAAGKWGRPTLERFREIFGFGKDIFLVNVGNQLLEASQLIIVTRTMGLTAAAIWSVSTKLFALIYQLVTKVEGTAIVFFAEMMVRGEVDRLAARFRQVYQFTAGLTVISLAFVVAINKAFVSLWADPSLAWSIALSAWIAALVFLSALTRCSADLIVFTKKLGLFRYLYFAEAIVFVSLALWLSGSFGFYGILGPALLCLVLFRVTYTTWWMAAYFKLPMADFWWTWLKRPVLAATIITPFVLSVEWLSSNFAGQWAQLLVASTWVGIPAMVTFFLIAIPWDVKEECFQRWRPFSLSKWRK